MKHIEAMVRLIDHHSHLYHVMDDPFIKDQEFDSLVQEYRNAIVGLTDYPKPRCAVGFTALNTFEKKAHYKPMLSLSNTFTLEGVMEFVYRFPRGTVFCLEYKMDGMALDVEYVNGKLVTALSRGNGEIGEDITENALTIRNLPHATDFTGHVRGEVIIPSGGFKRMVKEQVQSGVKPYVTARNAAAGSMRKKNSQAASSRPLAFFAYSTDVYTDLDNHEACILRLKEALGYTIPHIGTTSDLNEIIDLIQETSRARYALGFDIDGVVIKVNDFNLQVEAGYSSDAPKWAISYKFPPTAGMSTIEDVVWQVGRTGIVTPVAKIKPVRIDGVLVSSVTLCNVNEIARLGVMLNDKVTISRQGDVIPKVTSVWVELRTGEELAITPPQNCPCCTAPLSIPAGGVGLYCHNAEDCSAQLGGSIIHFCSSNGFNIMGLGSVLIDQLVDGMLLTLPSDVFTVLPYIGDTLINLDGWGDLKVKRLLSEIQQARTIPLVEYLVALGIRYCSLGTSMRLAGTFLTIDAIEKATLKELMAVKDIGEITAASIHQFFARADSTHTRLKGVGVIPTPIKPITGGQRKICITGTFKLKRKEIVEALKKQGWDVCDTITGIDALLLGEKPSGKAAQAILRGIKILESKDFDFLA